MPAGHPVAAHSECPGLGRRRAGPGFLEEVSPAPGPDEENGLRRETWKEG